MLAQVCLLIKPPPTVNQPSSLATMSITSLPAELIIRIIYYTPIQTIIALSLTSSAFYDLVSANENAIYQAAAKFHGFDGTPRASSAPESLKHEKKEYRMDGWLDDVYSWKELCVFS